MTNKYAEGYPGKRWYNGCEWVDGAETLAIQRAKELFGAEHLMFNRTAEAVPTWPSIFRNFNPAIPS